MDDFETAKQFFIEGLQLLEANNLQGAELKFEQSLELVPGRVSTLNNLSVIKIKLRKFTEAEKLALKALAIEERSPEAWTNLGTALAKTERHEEALQAYDRALNCNSSYARAWLNKAMTLLELKRYDEALRACNQALILNPSHHKILYTKSLILKQLERPEEAKKTYLKSIEMRVAISPIFITVRRATQKADILIINENPEIDDSLKSFETLLFCCPNFPGQLAEHLHKDFHFTYVFKGDAANGSARKQIPQPDFVINNNANGENILLGGNLLGLIETVDSFGVPVVNHPSKVVQTIRDESAKLIEDVSGVLVPKTIRFSLFGKTHDQLVHEIEDQYDYPLITRSLIAQRGIGMTKVDSRDALLTVLASDFPKEFFVTEFVDSRGGNKFFRKIRAAIVKDEIIIVRVDYGTHWNIHGRKSMKRVPFYLENFYLLDEEKRICLNPEAGLGRSAIQSLQAIRNRIPMDVFGIDFDVDADGKVVFYEANATMNLFSTAQKQVPNPKEAEDSLKLGFQRYFMSLVAHR